MGHRYVETLDDQFSQIDALGVQAAAQQSLPVRRSCRADFANQFWLPRYLDPCNMPPAQPRLKRGRWAANPSSLYTKHLAVAMPYFN